MVTEKMIEAAAEAIWEIRRVEEDRCDMSLEDIGGQDSSVWHEARAALEAALSTDAEPVAHPQFEARMRDAIRFTVRETLGFVNAEIVNELFNNVTAVINHCAPPAPPVAVKALEWKEGEGGLEGQFVWSSGDPWVFWIVKNPDSPDYVWCENMGIEGWNPCSPVRGLFPTLEEAKAAAQADYEARIRSALSAQAKDAT